MDTIYCIFFKRPNLLVSVIVGARQRGQGQSLQGLLGARGRRLLHPLVENPQERRRGAAGRRRHDRRGDPPRLDEGQDGQQRHAQFQLAQPTRIGPGRHFHRQRSSHSSSGDRHEPAAPDAARGGAAPAAARFAAVPRQSVPVEQSAGHGHGHESAGGNDTAYGSSAAQSYGQSAAGAWVSVCTSATYRYVQ